MVDEIVLERILNGAEEPKDLPLALLQQITNDFSEERKIGQGGFGVVYKGVLQNGIIVAVKRIEVSVITIDDVSFRREINSLMKINHENVVRFLGFCSHAYHTSIKEAGSRDVNFVNVRERLLCLEYVSNGSLDKHITDELRGLEWEKRYEILIGICKGLRYLHEEKQIVHMDLKPANILLDDHMVPKITDFGLSRPNENSHTMGQRFGTRGYLAPEYENAGRTSVKSDIYGLGAIIIELVTGCIGVPDENNVLRRWRHRWSKPPTLLQYRQVTRCINTALRCKEQKPEARPSILEIISFLSKSESTDMHTGQISPRYDEDDVLGIKPLELWLPSELKDISCLVELTNDTANCIAFNIQPSSPPRYSAQPDKGIVRPQSKYGVKIMVSPQDMHHGDKFIVKSMKVNEGLRDEDITERMFEEANKVVDEVNLMVVYEPAKPQENCESREHTNMPAEEVPEVERRKIVVSASKKGKLCSGENAEAASMLRLGSVVAKAGEALVAELLRAWGLDASCRKLELHLLVVQDILLGAEDQSRTSIAVRRWMKDLQTAANQADDVLDDLCYEALRLRAKAQIRPRSKTCKVLSYFTKNTINSPVAFRLLMSRKMKDALKMIDELVVEMNKFHFVQHTEESRIVHPQTHSQINESEIVGREDEKELVVKILLDHSHNNNNDNNNIVVLPIVGMGGIGKTTLAKLVHNDQRVVRHFELILWVCISDKFVIEEIIQSIVQVATMKKSDLTNMEALQKDLCRVLGKKRYLLVLDDVWNEDRHKWDDMRSLLCAHAGSGSAIIVTSRSNRVASIVGTLPPHQISLLDKDQSWELFQRNTFGRGVEKQNELISMAKSIVHKCKGLPLAIKTMSTLLCSKHHSQWFSVLDSHVWKNDILATGIVPALQLSYDHLSSEAKICFSFCAIFPKDRPMDKDMLIQLWMANEFIASETRGQQIFDVLVWRCFLQDVEIQNNQLNESPDEYDVYINSDTYIQPPTSDKLIQRPTTCKMHDLMHDLADYASGNDCFILQESSSCQEILQGTTYASSLQHDVQHLSLGDVTNNIITTFLQESSSSQEILQGSTDANSLQHEVQHFSLANVSNNTITAIKEILAPQPRTILDFQSKFRIWITLSMAESKFMSLRALKTLSIITYMTNLKHLRYLDCSYSSISALPGATTTLYSLQTLRLICCPYLKKLPEGMRYMSSLRHIFLIGCYSLERMPQGIGQLNSLQTLTNYVIDSDAGRGIDQLKDSKLGGALSLTELRKVHSAKNAKDGNMSAKHNLKRLSLNWYGPYSTPVACDYEVDTNAEGILEALRPHSRLEVLLLSDYTGVKLSSWMHNSTLLEHLSELHLIRCRNCKDLPPLWQLPFLGYLGLDNLDSLTSICVGNDDTDNGESCVSPPPFFPKLETMIIYKMPKLERWHQEVAGQVAVVSFPQLKKLDIWECPRLETLPEGLLQQLPALEELEIWSCPKLNGAFTRGGAYWNLVEAVPKRRVF